MWGSSIRTIDEEFHQLLLLNGEACGNNMAICAILAAATLNKHDLKPN